ncbi:MAG TPA: protease pro-enzyme activation domain-containing protein [Verrucomicrobiae bacterium]|nr:protease pro-enzyme activation domain-containing protein [Verrucomicrobiae bacterium]
MSLALITNARAAERQVLRGHAVKAVSEFNLAPVERLATSTNLDLAICLPLRNQDALTNLLQQQYEPTSPQYHHWLTPEEFAAQFGPTEQDYQAVIEFARANGFTITGTHPNRTLLDVRGSVANIERTFRVTLHVYQHPTEAREFYAPDVEPSLDLMVPVLRIGGLDNFAMPRPLNVQRTPQIQPEDATPDTGSGPGGAYMGSDFRTAYAPGVPLDGSGQIVALVEFDGYHAADITKYESQAKLPNVTLTNVSVDGFGGTPSANLGQVLEVSLDIEMTISMAPGLREVAVYEAASKRNPLDILNQIATDDLARQISCSWGLADDDSFDQVYQQFAAQGQSFFQASGDNGAFNSSFPNQQQSDTPFVTLVGGTTLTTGSGKAWHAEAVWNWNTGTTPADTNDASGGGISTTYLIPSWQADIDLGSSKGSTTRRNVPDVAMTADNIFVIYNKGSMTSVGGTSCSAPLWAGFAALVNQQAVSNQQPSVGFINPAIYAIGTGSTYTVCFHDIKTGNNETFYSPTKFSAVTGYDLCTGWGTPTGSNLVNALVGTTNLAVAALCRDVTTNADADCLVDVPASAVDNGSYSTVGTIISRSLSPPGPYPQGVTQVTLSITDSLANAASCIAFVTVVDGTPPSITCPDDIVTNVPSGVTKVNVNFATPLASDNCGVPTVSCTPASGSSFKLGTTPVICTATDAAGNTNNCTFDITVTQGGGTNACTFTLNATDITLAAKGGKKNVSVKVTGTGCSWTAVSNDPFITITSGSSGTGNGKVDFTVPGNTNSSPLIGTMTIAGQTFTVNQAAGGCTLKLSPKTGKIKATGGAATVKVTPNFSDCAWTAVSNDGFITITGGASGVGKGTVSYTVAPNTNTTALTGSITIGTNTFTVTEAAAK